MRRRPLKLDPCGIEYVVKAYRSDGSSSIVSGPFTSMAIAEVWAASKQRLITDKLVARMTGPLRKQTI